MHSIRMRSSIVRVRAESKPPSVGVFRKNVEEKRKVILKENLNKLTLVATEDFKFVSETFTELDKMHKAWFDKAFKGKNSTSGASVGSDDTDISDVNDVNVFLKD